MPTYIYRCNDDLTTFELWKNFTDESVPDCPRCKKPMSKVYTANPPIFRGDGWAGKK